MFAIRATRKPTLFRAAFSTAFSLRADIPASTPPPAGPPTPSPPTRADFFGPDGKLLPPSLLPHLPREPKKPVARQFLDDTEVDPNHPLWAFFRKDESTGKVLTMENMTESQQRSGRPFTAEELRVKSFQELHTLWFLLLREKNIFYTQREEMRRRGIRLTMANGTRRQRAKIATSMARIKYVMNERRLAYLAVQKDAEDSAEQAELEAEQAELEKEVEKLRVLEEEAKRA